MGSKVRARAVAAGLVIGAVALAGCSSGDTGEPAASGHIESMTVASFSKITTLDVAKLGADASISSLTTEPLVRIKSDGEEVLAAAQEVTSTDDSLTITMRPDLVFSDGTPVTLDDVLFSVERITDPAQSPITASSLGSVASVRAKRPDQVVVTYKHPDPTLRPNLLFAVRVVSKKQVQAHPDDFGSPSVPPIGSGPYRVEEFNSSGVTLVRNEHYWGDKPPADKITFVDSGDEFAGQMAMRSGDLDLKFLTDGSQAKPWSEVPGSGIAAAPSGSSTFLSLDVTSPPFDDIHVRRAVAYAIDRENLIDIVYGGHAEPLQSLVSTQQLASVSSPDEAAEFLESLPSLTFDMEKAREELAASSHPDGFSLDVVTCTAFSFGQKVLLSLKQNLAPLGIDLNVKALSYEQWGAQILAHEDLGMQTWDYGALTPDPAQLLNNFVSSEQAVPNGSNTANYHTPQVDEALQTLMTSPDAGARFDASKSVLTALADDLPYIPLFEPQMLFVTSSRIEYDDAQADGADYTSGLWAFHVVPKS